jgi:transmembrane sensor
MFDVERDGPRVLRVLAGRTVLSTRAARFSVRLRDVGNIDLLVSKGQVTVGTTVIGELQIAKVTPDGMRLRALSKAEAARRFQWIHGRLAFAGEPLVEAVAEFNRYNRRQLVIGDRAISLIPIGGQFGVSDMQSFVAALRLLGVRTAGSDENGIRLVAADGED